jgi:hypothetical protein
MRRRPLEHLCGILFGPGSANLANRAPQTLLSEALLKVVDARYYAAAVHL